MKNSKLTKALLVVSAIGAITSIIRLIVYVLDRKSETTDQVLYEYAEPEMYDQDVEYMTEEDIENE